MQLTDDEFSLIRKYLERLGNARRQLENLMQQGNEIAEVINTAWVSATRRMKLEDPEFDHENIPPMVNVRGELIVSLNTKGRIAEWQSVHDVKRVAKSDAIIVENGATEESDEEEKGDE